MMESHLDLYREIMLHRLNMVYLIVVIFIVYELAWVARQKASEKTTEAFFVRMSGAIVGTILVFKAIMLFDGEPPATILDILREFLWSVYLFSSVIWGKKNFGSW